MANSKLRCRGCREYYLRTEVVNGFHSDECRIAHRNRQRPRKVIAPKVPKRSATFTPALKQEVRERDGFRCQACGATGVPLHVHHRKLRSQGGTEQMENLVSVCDECHRFIHDNVAWSKERGFILSSWVDPQTVSLRPAPPLAG